VHKLREYGVYALPDESEVIAVADIRGAYLLYAPQDWTLYPHVPAVFEVYVSGQIHQGGKLTHWCIEDLSDTGRTGALTG
jgi:hypothetical protein